MAADARGAETDVDIAIDIDRQIIEPSSAERALGDAPTPTTVPDVEEQTATVIDLRTAEPIIEIERLAPPSGLIVASRTSLAIKRGVDIALAGFTLLALSPLFLAVAIAIKATSRGPVFFKQPRVGKSGELFNFVKFRSMRTSAVYEKPQLKAMNEKDGPIFKIRNDPRITKVGKVIRKLSIDELPQLAHVLSGKMSLVGPRPHLPEEVSAYDARAHRRLDVKPGITCIWQVSGRADLDFETWIDLDLEYIETWSLGLDAKLLVQTVPAVLTGKGAY